MGGASGLLETPTNRVLLFQPHENPGANVASYSNGVLNRAMRLHSTAAYDGKIYAFNGYATDTSGPIAWVQSYNVETGKARSSWDDPTTSSEIRVNKYMTSDTTPTPAIATDSGNIYWTYHGWQAFDGTSSSGSGWTTNGTSGEYIIYDSGNSFLSFIVNKLWIHNALGDPNGGTKDFTFSGYDGISWSLIATGTVPYASTGFNYSFNNSTPYQKYKFQMDSAHGSAISYGVREIEFFHENIRRVSPQGAPPAAGKNHGACTYTYADGKVIKASSQEDTTSDDEAAWRAFDGTVSGNPNQWDSDSTTFPQWISLDLGSGKQDYIDIVRLKFAQADNGVKDFVFQGSNVTSPNSAYPHADWTTLHTVASLTTTDEEIWHTYYLDTPAMYRHYRLVCLTTWTSDIELWEIEYYSTQTTPPATEPILTKTMNNYRTPVKLQAGAACTTPYGIVIAGGLDDTGNATSTAMVYWPHAIDHYNSATDQQWGICSSLPPMPQSATNHCLVWHNGKLYRVGGNDSGSLVGGAFSDVDVFDFETNAWSTIAVSTDFTDRNLAGACSLGDEIFIFGGLNSAGTPRTDAAAWNPETGKVRKFGNIPVTSGTGINSIHSVGITAVPYGPYIYLIGGAVDDSGLLVGKEIIRFSP
jgi:hypothetical protein